MLILLASTLRLLYSVYMDPNQYPQTSQDPQQSTPGRFDYILNAEAPKKAKLFGSGNGGNQKQRTLISVIFVLAVVSVAIIGFGVFSSLTKKDYSAYKTLLEKQTEIIRIADLGSVKSRTVSVKNYVASIKSVTVSEKNDTAAFLKAAHVKIDEKALAAKSDANNDKALTTAEHANQYDEKLAEIINTLIIDYQKDIASLGNSVSTKTERALVTTLQTNAKVLANAPKVDTYLPSDAP